MPLCQHVCIYDASCSTLPIGCSLTSFFRVPFQANSNFEQVAGFFFNHLILFPWDNKLLQKFKRSWNYTTEKLTSAQGKNFHWVIKRNHSRIFVWTHELDYCNEKPSKEFCRDDFLPHRLWNNLHRNETYTMETNFHVLHALFLVKV